MRAINGSSFDLPILMYHHIVDSDASPESSTLEITRGRFREQLDFLSDRGFSAISFSDLFAAVGGMRELPARPVIITFDDGYASFADIGVPELVSRNMTATVFIVANAIGRTNSWDADCGRPLHQLMDDTAIRAVMAAGMGIGVHGWNHLDLKSCNEKDVFQEIVGARQEMVRRFGIYPSVFSYPFGRYREEHFALLANAGYSGAVTMFSDRPTVTDNFYCMRRIYAHQADGAVRIAIKLSSLYLRYVALRDSRRGQLCH